MTRDADSDAPSLREWTWAVRDSDLPAPSKLICLMLATRHGPNRPRPFPSIEQIAEDAGLARSTVIRHLNLVVEEDGRFVRRVERSDAAGRQTSNEYRLVLPGEGGRVSEIDPGVSERDPRGSQSETGEGPAMRPEEEHKEEEHKKGAVARVWTHYVERYADRYSESRAERLKLSACGRPGHVRARLEEGYTEEELCLAIDGCFDDPWHRERDKVELEYIVRNQSQVEKFLSRAKRNGRGAESSARDSRAATRAALDAIERGGRGE